MPFHQNPAHVNRDTFNAKVSHAAERGWAIVRAIAHDEYIQYRYWKVNPLDQETHYQADRQKRLAAAARRQAAGSSRLGEMYDLAKFRIIGLGHLTVDGSDVRLEEQTMDDSHREIVWQKAPTVVKWLEPLPEQFTEDDPRWQTRRDADHMRTLAQDDAISLFSEQLDQQDYLSPMADLE